MEKLNFIIDQIKSTEINSAPEFKDLILRAKEARISQYMSLSDRVEQMDWAKIKTFDFEADIIACARLLSRHGDA